MCNPGINQVNEYVCRRIIMLHRRKKVPLFVLAALLFGFKTYIVYRFVFDIELDNLLQEIIIFINPFIASIIFFGLSVWFKTEKRQKLFIRSTISSHKPQLFHDY